MKLSEFLKLSEMNQLQLARKLKVSEAAVSRYLRDRMPAPPILRRIHRVSGGAVTPNDFYDIGAQ